MIRTVNNINKEGSMQDSCEKCKHLWSCECPAPVINIFSVRKRRHDDKFKEEVQDGQKTFLDNMKKTAENKARIAKERAKANKDVIRSHRLKR